MAHTAEDRQTTTLRADLRSAVIRRLGERGLSQPDALSSLLGVAPSTATGLLRRSEWSIEQSLWVNDQAGLGVEVAVVEPMADERLAEIEAMLAAITPPPWEPYFTTHGDPYVAQAGRSKFGMVIDSPEVPRDHVGMGLPVSTAADDYGRADCRSIAASPTIVTELLAEVRRRARR